MNLAIFSPNQNPYSETFIQAHKNHISADKLYFIYGNSFQNMQIENKGLLLTQKKQLWIKGMSKLSRQDFKNSLIPRFAKRLQELQIDVALIEYGTHAMRLLPVLESAKIPFVVHFHGYDATDKSVLKTHHNYRELFSSAKAVVAVSTVMYKKLLKLGCPEHKLRYNVYGANPIFKQRQPQFTKKQAVAIGRFVDKKAPYYTIMAFKQVVKKHPDAKLVMAGHGPLWATCKNLIRFYKLEQNVDLVGVLTPDEVAKLMEESYCFVQHSITAENGNQEGTPLAVLESALSGLPVVSTYHAGIPDVIIHEETGLLSPEHDVDKMTQHIIKLFDDVDYAKQLGAQARKDHEANYSLARHIKSLENTLNEAISES